MGGGVWGLGNGKDQREMGNWNGKWRIGRMRKGETRMENSGQW